LMKLFARLWKPDLSLSAVFLNQMQMYVSEVVIGHVVWLDCAPEVDHE